MRKGLSRYTEHLTVYRHILCAGKGARQTPCTTIQPFTAKTLSGGSFAALKCEWVSNTGPLGFAARSSRSCKQRQINLIQFSFSGFWRPTFKKLKFRNALELHLTRLWQMYKIWWYHFKFGTAEQFYLQKKQIFQYLHQEKLVSKVFSSLILDPRHSCFPLGWALKESWLQLSAGMLTG